MGMPGAGFNANPIFAQNQQMLAMLGAGPGGMMGYPNGIMAGGCYGGGYPGGGFPGGQGGPQNGAAMFGLPNGGFFGIVPPPQTGVFGGTPPHHGHHHHGHHHGHHHHCPRTYLA